MPNYKFHEKLLCPHCGEVESDYQEDFAEQYVCKGLKYPFTDFCICSKCGSEFAVMLDVGSDVVQVGKLVIVEIEPKQDENK